MATMETPGQTARNRHVQLTLPDRKVPRGINKCRSAKLTQALSPNYLKMAYAQDEVSR